VPTPKIFRFTRTIFSSYIAENEMWKKLGWSPTPKIEIDFPEHITVIVVLEFVDT